MDIRQNLPPIEPEKGNWDEQVLTRRGFLELGFWSVTGLTGLILGGAGTRFLIGHSLTSPDGRWIELGPIAELPAGQMHRIVYAYRTTDVWHDVDVSGIVYAFSEDGAEYRVLNATCSHLGCNVRWREETSKFACPCHRGEFNPEGQVLGGPPPKALSQLETKIENGVLMALI